MTLHFPLESGQRTRNPQCILCFVNSCPAQYSMGGSSQVFVSDLPVHVQCGKKVDKVATLEPPPITSSYPLSCMTHYNQVHYKSTYLIDSIILSSREGKRLALEGRSLKHENTNTVNSHSFRTSISKESSQVDVQ